MGKTLPTKARVVIVGGGVIGASVAYHLAKLGWKDIVLLERKQFTSGTTWHAAGLVAQLRATHNMTRLAKYSQELYGKLEAETGAATGFRRNGSITVALSDERLQELKRGASMARVFGVEIEEISVAECKECYPLLNTDGVVGGVYLPKDGQADPSNVALALIKGAQQNGAQVFEHTKVTAISTDKGRVTGVSTDKGDIEADYVVNCGGMWGREVGQMAGVNVPLHACEHFYIVTDSMPELLPDMPVLRVPDECAYYKEDAGKLLLGAFEPVAKPWGHEGIPDDFCFDELPEDFDHFAPILEQAVNRFPALETAGIHTFFNGPESFTPDDRYLLGEAPEVKNFYVAAGFNSVGIQSAGGAGMALAQWMDGGEAPFDLWDVDIRRMLPYQNNKTYLYNRSKETLGLLFADHFPYRQYGTARGIRRSSLHDKMADLGACFGEVAGWERPNWFLTPEQRAAGEKAEYKYSWGRQNWFENSAREHKAVREGVGFFDMSSFGKIRVDGPDAEAVLQKICGNNVAVAPGKIVYTQFLNQNGGVEADVTITRLAEDQFLVVTPAATPLRDLTWLKRQTPEEARCYIYDATSSECVIPVMGPNSRELLAKITDGDLSNEAFPFATAQNMELGMAEVRAHRVTYVGELGWELYTSTEMGQYVFETLWAAGESMGLTPCGMHTLDSLRMEKGYRHFGHDITDEDHVVEAGLGFAVKVDKPASRFGDFTGRAAVIAKKEAGLSKRLVQFQLNDAEPLLYHAEPIYRDGKMAGFLTSGNYGHHLGGAMGLGYVDCEPGEKAADVLASTYEIEVAGVRMSATASLKPLYDPKSERVKM